MKIIHTVYLSLPSNTFKNLLYDSVCKDFDSRAVLLAWEEVWHTCITLFSTSDMKLFTNKILISSYSILLHSACNTALSTWMPLGMAWALWLISVTRLFVHSPWQKIYAVNALVRILFFNLVLFNFWMHMFMLEKAYQWYKSCTSTSTWVENPVSCLVLSSLKFISV